MADIATVDPYVVIEEQSPGYTRYRNITTGRRWEVHGTCDRRGDCLIGAVISTPRGQEKIEDAAHLEALTTELGQERIDTELDVPVTPEFDSCCPFTYVEL